MELEANVLPTGQRLRVASGRPVLLGCHCSFFGGRPPGLAISQGTQMRFLEFCDQLGETPKTFGHAVEKTDHPSTPWDSVFMDPPAPPKSAGGLMDPDPTSSEDETSSSSSSAHTPRHFDELSDNELDNIYHEADLAMQELEDQTFYMPAQEWKIAPQQGESNIARSGVFADSYCAAPRSREAKAWIRRYWPQYSMANDFKKYDRRPAMILTLAWLHKMERFYSIHPGVGHENYVYSEDDILSYEEPEFVHQELNGISAVVDARLDFIRTLVPHPPKRI